MRGSASLIERSGVRVALIATVFALAAGAATAAEPQRIQWLPGQTFKACLVGPNCEVSMENNGGVVYMVGPELNSKVTSWVNELVALVKRTGVEIATPGTEAK